MADTPKLSPFDLLVQGATKLIQKQETDQRISMEQYRQAALENFYQSEELPPETTTPESTAINSYSYNPRELTLRVEWVGGRQYLYYGIEPSIAQGLDAAPSAGQYMNEVVKAGFFPFTRLS